MKNKSRHTTRREGRRITEKRKRAAARQLIHQGGGAKLIRGDGWSDVHPIVVETEESAHQPHRKPGAGAEPKPFGKKGGCPARGGTKRHHYLYETVSERSFWDGPSEVTYKMCGYCGEYSHAWRRLKPRRRRIRWGRTPGNATD